MNPDKSGVSELTIYQRMLLTNSHVPLYILSALLGHSV